MVVELLKGAGTEICTGELVAVLLCSLPESYSGLITALEGRDEAELTVEYVTSKMLDEYQRRVESCGNVDDDGIALRMSAVKSNKPRRWREDRSSKKVSRICFFCKRPGHLKADCEAFKNKKASERPYVNAFTCPTVVIGLWIQVRLAI
uniref:CCHC-type domain-containing protein n=1 Tax=Trichuris muris TaxID=70415 RepID=A0A5S6QQT1_TRIMR